MFKGKQAFTQFQDHRSCIRGNSLRTDFSEIRRPTAEHDGKFSLHRPGSYTDGAFNVKPKNIDKMISNSQMYIH